MLFNYEAITSDGERKTGSVEAVNKDLAIAAIQKRGYIVRCVCKLLEENENYYPLRNLHATCSNFNWLSKLEYICVEKVNFIPI